MLLKYSQNCAKVKYDWFLHEELFLDWQIFFLYLLQSVRCSKCSAKTAACNYSLQFANHYHEFFCFATWFDERPNRKLCRYDNMQLLVVSWWKNCEKAPQESNPKKYIYTKQQNQNRPAISWKKKFILLWKCIIFCNNVIRAKKTW